jgi:hypothetical protein
MGRVKASRLRHFLASLGLLPFLLRPAMSALSSASPSINELNLSFPYCHAQIDKVLNQWHATGNWRLVPGGDSSWEHFIATTHIGVWISVQAESDSLTLERVESSSVTSMKFAEGNCIPKLKLFARQFDSKPIERLVTDADIREFARKNQNGAIYTWSPGMPYSVDGLKEMRKFAADRHLQMLVVLDPGADRDQALRILKKKGLPVDFATKSDSIELRFRNAYNHFPTCILFKHSDLNKNMTIPGYKLAQSYIKEFDVLR